MKKIVTGFISVIMVLVLISGCGGTQVTSVKKTEADATQREDSVEVAGEANEISSQDTQVEEKIYSVGERAVINDMYAITILGVSETEERNQFSDKVVSQVLIIDYLYENLIIDEDLYISDMNFKFVDDGGNMCDTYPVSGQYSPEYTPKGAKNLSSMVIGTIDSSNTIKVLFYDNMFNSKSNVEFNLNIGESITPELHGQMPHYDEMYSMGDIIEIKTDDGHYTLSIDSVELVTDRNQFSDKEPNEVYKIGYTYSNISYGENLYISEMDFRVIDGNGSMGFTYPGNVSKHPQETIKGAKCSAEMIFGTYTESNALILGYTDNMFSDTSDLKIIINTK